MTSRYYELINAWDAAPHSTDAMDDLLDALLERHEEIERLWQAARTVADEHFTRPTVFRVGEKLQQAVDELRPFFGDNHDAGKLDEYREERGLNEH